MTPGLILAFGLCFLFITVPTHSSLASYRMARTMMGCSYIVFFIALVAEAVSVSLDTSPEFLQIIMISIALLQAFLFTFALITLLDVNFFTRKRFITEAVIVVGAVALAFLAFSICSEKLGFMVFLILSVFYFYKLVEYVARFMKTYRDYERKMSNFFSDDEKQRLQWVKRFFFEALAIGILALLYSFFPTIITGLMFTVIMGVYYTIFGIRFINYAFFFKHIETAMTDEIPVVVNDDTKRLTPGSDEGQVDKTVSDADWLLMERLDSILADNRLYNKPYLTIEDLAVKAGVSYRLVSATINKCKGVTFKRWINTYRVEEALHLIEGGYLTQHTIEALAQTVGFTNRVNFYRVFKSITGHSPTDY